MQRSPMNSEQAVVIVTALISATPTAVALFHAQLDSKEIKLIAL